MRSRYQPSPAQTSDPHQLAVPFGERLAYLLAFGWLPLLLATDQRQIVVAGLWAFGCTAVTLFGIFHDVARGYDWRGRWTRG